MVAAVALLVATICGLLLWGLIKKQPFGEAGQEYAAGALGTAIGCCLAIPIILAMVSIMVPA